MIIRDLRKDDYEAVEEIMRQIHTLHVKGKPDFYAAAETVYEKSEFGGMTENENKILLAAEEDGVEGICIISIRYKSNMIKSKTAYLDVLGVREDKRRKGIATKLFCEAEKRAKAAGAKRLDLMVWDFNKTALKFYKAMGMTEQRYIFEKPLQ